MPILMDFERKKFQAAVDRPSFSTVGEPDIWTPYTDPLLKLKAARGEGHLLSKNDPPEYVVLNEAQLSTASRYMIVCDHASKAVPAKLGNLGLPDSELSRHIGWDIGTEEIGRYMSEKLKAPAIIAGYSRLVVDLNRGKNHAQQIPSNSDGTLVPGNQGLDAEDRTARRNALYETYHGTLDRMLEWQETIGGKPLLVFVHSCTAEMNGKKRPWEIGVLWSKNKEISHLLMDELQRENAGYLIGNNQPYSLRKPMPGNSIERHAEQRGLPHVVVEFRQDLIDTPEKAQEMAKMFTRCLERAVERLDRLKHNKGLKRFFARYSDKKSSRHPAMRPQLPRSNNVRPPARLPAHMW